MNPLYPDTARRAGHRCEYCHAPEAAFNFPFEVEHITPTASGGEVTSNNLALACRSCNAFKAVREIGTDSETQASVSLFHPRSDGWEDHFAIDPETLTVLGKTPTGRAAVITLQMNSSAQLLARQQWRRLELFP